MNPTRSPRTSRHPVRVSSRPAVRRAPRSGPAGWVLSSRTVQVVLVTMGAIGLAGLALALLGPERLEREIVTPMRKAVQPQAAPLWAQAQPLRNQIGTLLTAAGEERARLVQDFRDWIEGLRAA